MTKKKTFEQTMLELGEVVEQLETGECALEESLALFERGVKLTKECNAMLGRAEQKVTNLLQKEDAESKGAK